MKHLQLMKGGFILKQGTLKPLRRIRDLDNLTSTMSDITVSRPDKLLNGSSSMAPAVIKKIKPLKFNF